MFKEIADIYVYMYKKVPLRLTSIVTSLPESEPSATMTWLSKAWDWTEVNLCFVNEKFPLRFSFFHIFQEEYAPHGLVCGDFIQSIYYY